MNFSAAEKKIYAELLDMLIQELSNNGCNDFEVNVAEHDPSDLMSLAEHVAYDEEELEGLQQDINSGTVYFVDWVLVQNLKDKILEG